MKKSNITYCAEIGSNHCGSLDLARAHIRAAAEAGASAVKFQLFRAETLDTRPDIQRRLFPYELPLEWLSLLRDGAHQRGLTFGVTPFAIDLAEECCGCVDWIKISAYDLTYNALVSACAALSVPVVLSTAMATVKEIDTAVRLIYGQQENAQITLLHGTAAYPARLEDANLTALEKLKTFCTAGIGLSDHTPGYEAAMLAVAYGATWIEKHFKMATLEAEEILDRCGQLQESPDFEVSTDPWRFATMVGACERTVQALGTGGKNGPLDCELPLYRTLRRTNEKRLRG